MKKIYIKKKRHKEFHIYNGAVYHLFLYIYSSKLQSEIYLCTFFPENIKQRKKAATKIRSRSQKVILIFKKKKTKKKHRTLRNNREMLFKRTIFI